MEPVAISVQLAVQRSPLVTVVGLIPLALIGYVLYRAMVRMGRRTEPTTFNGLLPAYTKIISEAATRQQSSSVSGRFIAIDVRRGDFDALMFKLPRNLLAEVPGDVGAIIALDWDSETSCHVRVIDVASGTVAAAHSFAGTTTEPRPTAQIIAWAATLATADPEASGAQS